MKKILYLLVISALFCSSCSNKNAPKISIFCPHIEKIAKQEGISFAEAASLVRAMGYQGIDAWVTTPESEMKTLDSLGFKPASAIAKLFFTDGEQAETEAQALDFMLRHGFDKVLVVPGFLPEEDSDAVFDSTVIRFARFAQKAAEKGICACAEDYDATASPCYNMERLSSIFNASDAIGHVLDTGNYLFAGEDCLAAMEKFRPLIKHVHLKDRISTEDMSCPPVGTGCIPIKTVIEALQSSGYDGWFTVEEFGSKQMLKDVETSYGIVSKLIK